MATDSEVLKYRQELDSWLEEHGTEDVEHVEALINARVQQVWIRPRHKNGVAPFTFTVTNTARPGNEVPRFTVVGQEIRGPYISEENPLTGMARSLSRALDLVLEMLAKEMPTMVPVSILTEKESVFDRIASGAGREGG